MVSFASSVINKSGKKFAPKAPVRRAAATSSAPAPKKPSIERQTSQTPQPSVSKESSVVPSAADIQDTPAVATPTQTQSITHNEPATPNELASSAPGRQASQSPQTAVPIPAPAARRPSSTPIVPSALPRPTPPRPTPARVENSLEDVPTVSSSSQKTPIAENESSEPDSNSTPVETLPGPPEIPRSGERTTSEPVPDNSVEVRPAKRRKTTEVTIYTRNDGVIGRPEETRSNTAPKESGVSVVVEKNNQPNPKTAQKPARKPAKPRKKSTAEEAAEMVVDDVVGEMKPRARPRRRRASTPEDAESIEITPSAVKMSDLCRDLPRGKKSKREIELRSMDLAEAERKRNGSGKGNENTASKENAEDALTKADEERDKAEAESQAGPQMRIVNGEIVLDSSSLQIDRHAKAARNAEDMEEVEENPLTRRVNAGSYGKRSKAESWDEEMTDLFYRGLRMFGTDFMMISKMFPGRTRRQIKLKFGTEERKDPDRIKGTLLGPRESISLEAYSEMTNTVYDDPKIIQQELDEEKKRIEEEHAREKEAQKELLHNPEGNANGDASGNVLPSIEDASNGTPKKQKKKRARAGEFGGGTEEVLGSIDD